MEDFGVASAFLGEAALGEFAKFLGEPLAELWPPARGESFPSDPL